MDLDSLPQARLLGGVWKKNSDDVWHFNRRGPIRRALRWLISIGGWYIYGRSRIRWPNGRLRSPTPVSLFGHRITFFRGWWTLTRKSRAVPRIRTSRRKPTRQVYWSTDGTPGTAYRVTRGDPLHTGAFGRWNVDHVDDSRRTYCQVFLKPKVTPIEVEA